MRIKPVEVPDLIDAFNFGMECASARTRSGRYRNEADSQDEYWTDVYKDLIMHPFTHHQAARAVALMFAFQDFEGAFTPEIKARAVERAAAAPVNPAGCTFHDPAALFLSL